MKKMLLGVAVGTPVLVGVKYAVSEPRERRKMKILSEGVGRFCRSVCLSLSLSVCLSVCVSVSVYLSHYPDSQAV